MKLTSKTERCPHCKADLTGGQIPEEQQHLYGYHTHFDRKIGMYDMRRDMVTKWRCPDCNGEWDRL